MTNNNVCFIFFFGHIPVMTNTDYPHWLDPDYISDDDELNQIINYLNALLTSKTEDINLPWENENNKKEPIPKKIKTVFKHIFGSSHGGLNFSF